MAFWKDGLKMRRWGSLPSSELCSTIHVRASLPLSICLPIPDLIQCLPQSRQSTLFAWFCFGFAHRDLALRCGAVSLNSHTPVTTHTPTAPLPHGTPSKHRVAQLYLLPVSPFVVFLPSPPLLSTSKPPYFRRGRPTPPPIGRPPPLFYAQSWATDLPIASA